MKGYVKKQPFSLLAGIVRDISLARRTVVK
jgi:hypothetical protein